MFRICLVGLGRWGYKYYKTISRLNFCVLDCIVVSGANQNYPDVIDIAIYNDIKEVVNERRVDGFIIATPPNSHFKIANYCLSQGYPILLEKPFTQKFDQACELIQIAKKLNLTCMLGCQHLYSKKYNTLKKLLISKTENLNIYSKGLSMGPFRNNVTVFRDWGSHEIVLALDLFGELPFAYSIKKTSGEFNDAFKAIYSMELKFSSNRSFFSLFGNLSKVKRRTLTAKYKGGFAYINGLDQSGLTLVEDGAIIHSYLMVEPELMPVDLMLKAFAEECNTKNNLEKMQLTLNLVFMLDKIEADLNKEIADV